MEKGLVPAVPAHSINKIVVLLSGCFFSGRKSLATLLYQLHI